MKLLYMRIPGRPSISCVLLAFPAEQEIIAELWHEGHKRSLIFSDDQQQIRSERFYLLDGFLLVLLHPQVGRTEVLWQRGFTHPQITGTLGLGTQELFN
jgi:hypothetical protein